MQKEAINIRNILISSLIYFCGLLTPWVVVGACGLLDVQQANSWLIYISVGSAILLLAIGFVLCELHILIRLAFVAAFPFLWIFSVFVLGMSLAMLGYAEQ